MPTGRFKLNDPFFPPAIVHAVFSSLRKCSMSSFQTLEELYLIVYPSKCQNHNNSLASRAIHTNSRQCSSSARRVRVLHSRSCARTLITDDWALRLPRMYIINMLVCIYNSALPSVPPSVDMRTTIINVPKIPWNYTNIPTFRCMKHQYEHSDVPMQSPRWWCHDRSADYVTPPTKKTVFFLAEWNLFSISVTNQHQPIWQIIIIHSVRSSALWRGGQDTPSYIRTRYLVPGTPVGGNVRCIYRNIQGGICRGGLPPALAPHMPVIAEDAYNDTGMYCRNIGKSRLYVRQHCQGVH